MKYVFGDEQKKVELGHDELAVTFIDFTGMKQMVVCKIGERLPVLQIMPGTSPVVSL